MKVHFAGNDGHAQTVPEDPCKKLISSILHDIKGVIALVEDSPDRARLRRLKAIKAMLEEEMRS